MTGAEMDRQVAALLEELGLRGFHVNDSRRIPRRVGVGWPDWVIVGRRIIFRENKGSNDVLSPAQRAMARTIMHAGGDWAVWGPRDFYGGLVRAELEQLA